MTHARPASPPTPFFALLLLILLGVGQPVAATASVVRPADIDTEVRAAIAGARLSGQGSLKVFGFHIYDARLYVGPDGLGSDLGGDRPYALDLRYARAIKGRAIVKRTRQEMERIGAGTAEQRRRWEQQLLGLFPDVARGDHLTGVYRPGRGTVFLRNGRPIGEVAGAEFARAFFGIWLHPDSAAPDMRAALLGAARAS